MILVNRAKMTSATTGTGTLTLGSASSGYQSFASAGVTNLSVVHYCIEDGTAWEVGTGTYTTSGTTLSRGMTESSTGSAISCSGAQTVFVTALAVDVTPYAYGALFGTGADGTVTISSGATVLTRDMCYDNLTMSGTGSLQTNGFRVFVRNTLDISAAPANAIFYSTSGTGFNGSNTGLGGSPYNYSTSLFVTVPMPNLGATGGNGANGVGAAGNPGGSTITSSLGGNCYGGTSGNGGAGGAGVAAAGAGGSVTANTGQYNGTASSPCPSVYPIQVSLSGVLPISGGTGGCSGGAGGGDNTSVKGGGGGAGGDGGPTVLVAARKINRSGSTAAGAIHAKGWNGGNGGSPASSNAGGGGGGSGGGGGHLILICETLTGSAATGCCDVSGGNGGNGGNGIGTGANGTGGRSGASGGYEFYCLSNATYTNSAPGTNGSVANSTQTGGVATATQFGF